ncbi:MAG: hypothetical protein KKD75_06020, partial [Nanoarchaeota archaeon]|nr:hypothetical protein [Nanoarchaeota archaeon]
GMDFMSMSERSEEVISAWVKLSRNTNRVLATQSSLIIFFEWKKVFNRSIYSDIMSHFRK